MKTIVFFQERERPEIHEMCSGQDSHASGSKGKQTADSFQTTSQLLNHPCFIIIC
jgi:hypothetical protein